MSSSFPLSLSVKPLSLPSGISPGELFTPLANMPWAMWLDSGQSEHIDSCFDIIVWQPEATLTTTGGKTKVHYLDSNEVQLTEDDPLSILNTIQQHVLTQLESPLQDIPFVGGALGYFAYDLGRRFEKLPLQASHDIKLPEMAVGIYSQAVIFDHQKQQFNLVCPPEKRQQIEAFLQEGVSQNAEQAATQKSFSLRSSWQSNMNKASYVEKFEQVQDYLLNGDCYQINLAQRFSADYQGDEFQAYCQLREANQAPFSAFMRFEDSAILSVSPERFLKLSSGKVQSKPIKGTMPRSDNKEQDTLHAEQLKNSSKDRAENLMIVDLLRNDISKVCEPNSVTVPKLFDVESFPAVHHLVSTVEGKLATHYDACDLLRAAFPGGSITGAPKIRAMEIIEQLEPHRRSVYCGSIGYMSTCGTMDTSITIRTLVCEKSLKEHPASKIYCWAGGGLVADSTANSEYQETFDKVNRILPVLNNLTQDVSE
ncbi:MAG: aminodeoxychorismate synthase component I [Colwellia sp.]|nr:aminodeoxychorismate synthase component I [Colwellia sp.]MCW8864108.1 aminodeoxychorismate synthase component I [Colwellia sp.]MCW9082062.1 aminodeoxychorismate synthase component I [Colwellia sp.]